MRGVVNKLANNFGDNFLMRLPVDMAGKFSDEPLDFIAIKTQSPPYDKTSFYWFPDCN